MATFEVGADCRLFEAMESGRKTVYVLPATDEYQLICSGDRVEFGAVGAISVGFVRRYADLEALVEGESWANVRLDESSQEETLSRIRRSISWGPVEDKAGVLAIRVRSTLRK
ncbi:MAG: ASC-1-like (ASCH) protein [Cognaticolwellia sp.]|jgi:ASC-1-like (ASCH) protein